MSILITGGAGFIGSHTAKLFSESGLDIVILDNLVTGRRENACWGSFVRGDISEAALIRGVIREHSVSAVLHLAASAHAGDSVRRPDAYFANNVCGSLALLNAIVAEGITQFVFASSCAVYGDSASLATREDETTNPVSPYGESKLAIERALPWYESAYGLRWTALRYFNVAGEEDGLGEEPSESVRIIPRAVYATLCDGPSLEVFGTAFATLDGSAVRDYVHVSDVARANLKALQYIEQGLSGAVINIGSGIGVSVLQIIEAVGAEAKKAVPFNVRSARVGDPACVVSDPSRARQLLGWTPESSALHQMVSPIIQSCRIRAAAAFEEPPLPA